MNLAEYRDGGRETFDAFARLIETMLRDAARKLNNLPRVQAYQARAKTAESLELKLRDRKLLDSTKIEGEIKDLAGARVILYSDPDLDRYLGSRIIWETFDVQWDEMKVHYPTDNNPQAQYAGMHYLVSLKEGDAALPEYTPYAGMRCEIQVQTLLDHAWAESSHDIIYKARQQEGFGTEALEKLKDKLLAIKKDHLKPAGYDLQQVQIDFEKWLRGKALFDKGALDALEKASDNNTRFELLTTIRDSVIPHSDDINAFFPQVCATLEKVVIAAIATEPTAIDSELGPINGHTGEYIFDLAVDTIQSFRLADVVVGFNTLVALYPVAKDGSQRKRVVEAIKRLVGYEAGVWRQVGPSVQLAVADILEGYSAEEIEAIRPLVLEAWHEIISLEMENTHWSSDSVSIGSASVPAIPEIATLRERGFNALARMFDRASNNAQKSYVLTVMQTLRETPTRTSYTNELCSLVLNDTLRLVNFLSERADGFSYDLLEHIEHDLNFEWRRDKDMQKNANFASCHGLAAEIVQKIEAFRDHINQNSEFVKYKVLVGFEGVFPAHWEEDRFDYEKVEAYRKQKVQEFVASINDENEAEWYAFIQVCAATRSNDGATFPMFADFLLQLGEKRPSIALRYIDRKDESILEFLAALLGGLARSADQPAYLALLEDFLAKSVHLGPIARHLRYSDTIAPNVVQRVLEKSMAADDPLAVFECMNFVIQHFADQESVVGAMMRDRIFMPGLLYCNSKADTRWINGGWFLPRGGALIDALDEPQAAAVLENLSSLRKIDYHAERFLTLISRNWPGLVWEFFRGRLGRRHEEDEEGSRYEAIPYNLMELRKTLGIDALTGVQAVRSWYSPGDRLFEFGGGRLLHSIFPTCTNEFSAALLSIVQRGSSDDFDFAVLVLRNYRGEVAMHPVIQEIVSRVEENDRRMSSLQWCLESTGVVNGAFGMKEAVERKMHEVESWLDDPRPKVVDFGKRFIAAMGRRMALEQRRAETDIAMRKREYGEE